MAFWPVPCLKREVCDNWESYNNGGSIAVLDVGVLLIQSPAQSHYYSTLQQTVLEENMKQSVQTGNGMAQKKDFRF